MSDSLEQILLRVASLLPQQGPITAFAFLNPLEGLEGEPFVSTLRKIPQWFGCEPLLPETEYRKKLTTGRITERELVAVLHDEQAGGDDPLIAGLIPRSQLRLSMLLHPLDPGNARELRWLVAESAALSRFRADIPVEARERLLEETRAGVEASASRDASVATQSAWTVPEQVTAPHRRRSLSQWSEATWEQVALGSLWSLARERSAVQPEPSAVTRPSPRLRDQLLAATSEDPDQLVHEVLVQFCSAFLDQGYAHWRLPNRDAGFLMSFAQLFQSGSLTGRRWLKPLSAALQPLVLGTVTPLQSIVESLDLLGVEPENREDILRASVLALRGWAGMIWQMETRPDRVYRDCSPGTFQEFLAIRLLLDRLAAAQIARDRLGSTGDLATLAKQLSGRAHTDDSQDAVESRAYQVLQLAQLQGWGPQTLAVLSASDWQMLLHELDLFDSFERRRVFHFAYEHQLRGRALDAIATRAAEPHQKPAQPQLQIMTCIDAREESFRRHLEEVAPDVETFGNAGFFNVPMYYRGAGDADFAALCPIVIIPKNWIVEDVVYALEDSHRQRAMARRLLGTASHSFNVGSRSSLSGALLTAALGPLATVPLVGRILFPRLTAQMSRTARRFVAPPALTRLRLERDEGVAADMTDDGIGFTLTEMVAMGERALRDTGLTSGFARMVIILGHGSNCLNNPHESAYHCGACSGSAGGPNARALAAILNDVRVRRRLFSRGIAIPEDTWFIGGLHNTATEEITYFDLELLPTSHVKQLRLSRDIFSRVAERNAHERCRRFESARLDLTPAEALKHVQDRAEDLAQTRPEYGNCTNAVCFVGRRSRIRGLYLDRRSFQMSYDATQDDAVSSILARILAAVIPVCEGINMLYTLSAIDNCGFGCGTKLPHNVTSLLGVMDGAASDLRPGLPWQGVDIHEPVRLLFVIESTPEAMLRIMDGNPTVGRICRNGWAQIAVLDPHTARIQRFVNGAFQDYTPMATTLPVAESSEAWYRNQRDHLPFALIRQEAAVPDL